MSTAWRYAPILFLTAIIGCGDSKTASPDREQDRLQRRIASLEAENAELRDRANSLSLDLEHQRLLCEELRTRLRSARPEKQDVATKPSASTERPQTPEPSSQAVNLSPATETKPPTPTPVETAPPTGTAAKPSPPEAVPAAKPLLPDITPASAKKKPSAAPPPVETASSASPKAEPRTTESRPPERPPAPVHRETTAVEPVPTPDDPFAPFKRPPGAQGKPAPKSAPPAPAEETREAADSPAPLKPVADSSSRRFSSPPSELQLVDVSESRVGNAVHISGAVANNTKKAISRVRIKAAFLDAEGAAVASGEYPLAAGSLGGGQKAPFEITSPADPDIVKWRLNVLGEQ